MAKFLFVPVPVAGHTAPALVLVQRVVDRGHDVTVYGGKNFRSAIEETGARFAPFRSGLDLDFERLNELFPDRPQRAGLAQARWDLKKLMVDTAEAQHKDLVEILNDAPADAVVSDAFALSGQLVAEQRGLPNAVLNTINLFARSRDTGPDGSGLRPTSSGLGRLRNRLANWLFEDVALGDVAAHLRRLRQRLGLQARSVSVLSHSLDTSHLFMQPTVPSFEYPRSDLPPQVHFIGPLIPHGPTDWQPPPWWSELEMGRPVVLATQGTVAKNFDDLMRPALRGLAGQNVLVIAAAGTDPKDVTPDPPPNARLERFVPFAQLMPFVDVLITNGGYGGMHFALTHGVPLVVAGQTEDKTETCARVGWSGVGINLETSRATPEQIKGAVATVLAQPRYRRRARALQAELAQYDGPTLGAELLERLADTGTSVHRVAPAAAG